MKEDTNKNEKDILSSILDPCKYCGETDLKIGSIREIPIIGLEADNPFLYLGELDGWLIWRPFWLTYDGTSMLIKFKPSNPNDNLKMIRSHRFMDKTKDEVLEIYAALEKKYPRIYCD